MTTTTDALAIRQWDYDGVSVRKLSDDPTNFIRLSIGGGKIVERGSQSFAGYAVYRGRLKDVVMVLEQALAALREGVSRS
jgi:hypothetical protein